jgi:hypothetical protein
MGQKKFRVGNNLPNRTFSMIGAKGYAFIFAWDEDERRDSRDGSREDSNHKCEK